MSRTDELRARMHELFQEYLEAERELSSLEGDRFRVCIFGSARILPRDPIYRMVRGIARTLASLGMDIVTGGGPGLMDAANQGEQDARVSGGQSIGLPILLPNRKESANHHLDIKSEHSRFSTRLDEFMRLSHAVIVAPGGIGTLLELAYSWQLIQVGMLEPRPIVLLDSDFWGGLVEWMRTQQLRRELLKAGDLDFVHMADTQADVIALIRPALEKFRTQKRQVGENPTADNADTMLDHAAQLERAPEHQEPLPGSCA